MRKPDPVSKAWDAFYEANKSDDGAKLQAQGWRTVRQVADDLGVSVAAASSRLEIQLAAKKVEKRKARVVSNRGAREVTLYRPRTPLTR